MNSKNIIYLVLFILYAFVAGSCSDDNDMPEFKGGTEIVSFTLTKDGAVYKGAVTGNEIVITILPTESLEGATPRVEVSENATIVPDPVTITNWEEEIQFTVTGYDQSKMAYLYRVEHETITVSEDVYLTTQAEVDAFAARGVGILVGNLVIGKEAAGSESDYITNLNGLSALKRVVYNVVINPTYAGTSLEGLNGLESVGSLEVVKAPVLTDVVLRGLVTVNNRITISGEYIETVRFPVLTSLKAGIEWDAPRLVSLVFDALEKIGNSLQLDGTGSELLETLSFPKLTTLESDLSVTGFSALIALDLSSLRQVNNFTISDLPAIVNLTFPALEEVTGQLSCKLCEKLTSLAFPALERVGSLTFTGNTQRTNCIALTSLEFPVLKRITTSATLTTYYYNILQEWSFPLLEEVNGNFQVNNSRTGMTTNVERFLAPSLTTVEGRFRFYGSSVANRSLSEIDFSSLTSVGSAEFTLQGELYDFSTLANLILYIQASQWTVTNCGYNPDYQDMVEGKYIPEEE